MQRFDASRCKPVANDPPVEHRLDGNGTVGESKKELLH
jgi:hypothetical protein